MKLLENACELLKIFENNGFEAYIVGGFVRDYVLKRQSTDIDICTNATPKEVQTLFKDVKLPFEQYGAVSLIYKKTSFQITTYRMDASYKNNRFPSKIFYTDNLIIDLKRRDFTMNTLCMDSNGKIIDKLNATNDVKKHIVRCVGDADSKLSEDVLRILRAIRFATVLDFKLDNDIEVAIKNNHELLKSLSYYRKKEELNKIFSSPNALRGIDLLRKFKLDKDLDLDLSNIVIKTDDPLGIWAQIKPSVKYPFTANEKDYLDAISRTLKDGKINDYEIYKEGTYVCSIASQILGLGKIDVYNRFDNLPIKEADEVEITHKEIIDILKLEDKSLSKEIFKDIEENIVNKTLKNTYEDIRIYLTNNYLK